MSGLAPLLAGRTAPGVYHWTSVERAADVSHAAGLAGWVVVPLDTWRIEDETGFLDVCWQAFAPPAGSGRRLDSLGECLREVRGTGGGVLVLWDGWGPLARADRPAFDAVIAAFTERVRYVDGGRFAVLLRGPGPDGVLLPELKPPPAG
ncbi:MAG TPA: barstar family protein [Nocardioidaceae bacterium]|nr:barstar family protein [Nocardioidaceae bacterium]